MTASKIDVINKTKMYKKYPHDLEYKESEWNSRLKEKNKFYKNARRAINFKSVAK